MVAIVSGNSLGLDLTSLRTLGPQEFTGKALHGRAQGTYVNAANGNLVVQAVDGFAVGGGPDVQALRTYNSQGLLNDDNGDNWNSGVFHQPLQVVGSLNAAGSTIARTGRDGAVAIYTFDIDSQEYVTTQGDGAYDTVTYLADQSRLEWRDGNTGLTQSYEASGAYRLLFETNPDGEKLTYAYTGLRLDSVLTAAGEGTLYLYETDQPRANLKEVRTLDAGGICTGSTRYGYDLENRLISVTVDHSPGDLNVNDGDKYEMTYTYAASGSHRIATITEPGGITLAFTYVGDQVSSVTDALGHTTTFTYGSGITTIKDARGGVTRFEYDGAGQMTRITAPATGTSTQSRQFSYDSQGNVDSVTDGLGARTLYEYDDRGNQTLQRDAAGNTVRRFYDDAGRRTAEIDGNGTMTEWGYDNARQLLKQTNSREQQLAYKYDAAGQVTEIRDSQTGYAVKVTTYVYDLGGRRLVEKTVAGSEVHQDNRLAYDAQGKLRDISDTRVRMQLSYDANGNRTSVSNTVRYAGLNGEVLHKTIRYFRYDEMNRQTVVDAVDAAGAMDKNTHKLEYDENGNRTSDTYLAYAVVKDAAGAWTVREVLAPVVETYAYDDLNRLTEIKRDTKVIDTRGYDAADRVITSGAFLSNAYLDQLQRLVRAGYAGRLDTRINRYDANGRMLHQSVKSADGKAIQEISWDPTEAAREVYPSPEAAFRAEGYDHAGNVKGYTVFTHEGSKTVKYSTTLARFEGYVGTHSSLTESTNGETGMNKQVYDANGHLARVDDDHLTGNYRTFVNDAQGRALSTLRGGHVQRQLIVNGEVMGRYGVGVHDLVATDDDGYPNFADIADFNFSFASVSPIHPAPAPGSYTVQAGDTLQAIAQGAYGDSSLWYLIAQANGLSSNDDVRVGQVLNIPNRVGSVHNNEGTFKPYDPSKMTGDVAPSLPLPPEGCGGAGQVLMVVVAVAVTIFVGDPTVGSIVGSVVGQMVGLVTGTIDEFSWKSVALSAISAGVAPGLAEAAGLTVTGLGNVGNAIANAAIRNALTQGIGVATGLQDSFDWRGVAASAAAAGVGQAVGDALSGATYTEMGPQGQAVEVRGEPVFGYGAAGTFMRSAITGLAAGTTAAVMRGGRVSIQQVVVDAFGNALGQSLAEAAIPQNTLQENFRLGEIREQNEQGRRDAMYGLVGAGSSLGLRAGGGAGLSYAGVRSSEDIGDERYAGTDFASTGKVFGSNEQQALDPKRRGQLEGYWRGQHLYAIDESSTRRQLALMNAKVNGLNERINGLYGNDSGLRAALVAERDIHQNARDVLGATTPRERAETLAIGKVLDATSGLDRSQAADLVNRWLDQSLDSSNSTHRSVHAALIGDPRISKGLHGFDPTFGYDGGAGPLGVLNHPRLANVSAQEVSSYGRSGFGVSSSSPTAGFKSDRYVIGESADGRRVYKNLVDFDGGVPTHVDSSVPKSIRQRVQAGWSNKDLMEAGYAPIGFDGKQMNMHHLLGRESGPLVEISGTSHQSFSKQLHGLIVDGASFRNNPLLNNQYNSFRGEWWRQRSKDF